MSSQQPNLTALARQGDGPAIAALINRSLQPQGITAKVAHQDGHLRVLLEGTPIPEQRVLAPYIRQGILALQISGLHTLSVLGRAPGASQPAWSIAFKLSQSPTATTTSLSSPSVTRDQQPGSAKPTVETGLATAQRPNQSADQTTTATNPATIAAHLNQAMGSEALHFEATLSDHILKLTAKTDQILEGGSAAKEIQTLLLPLNLTDIDAIHLYKQKTKGNTTYKIKEFTLPRGAASEISADEPASAQSIDRAVTPSQSPRTQSATPAATPAATAQPAQRSRILMIAAAALAVVLFIGVIKFLAKPPAATEVCQDAAGGPGYCQLATQLVGEQTLSNLKSAATPLTPEMEERGLELCANAPELQVSRKVVHQRTRYEPSVRKEPLFPGVMLVEMQLKTASQPNLQPNSPADTQPNRVVFRSACLFAGDKSRVRLLKGAVLPNNWPDEPYQGKPEWEPMQRSLKAYQIIIMLGAGTLFTAIGLYVSAIFNLGFQIYTFRGLFQTASVLGTLDSLLIVSSGGHLQLFGGVPLTCLALGLTQVWVKDLRVDWAAGYSSVALGVVIMMVIRLVLNWLLIGFIFSVL